MNGNTLCAIAKQNNPMCILYTTEHVPDTEQDVLSQIRFCSPHSVHGVRLSQHTVRRTLHEPTVHLSVYYNSWVLFSGDRSGCRKDTVATEAVQYALPTN